MVIVVFCGPGGKGLTKILVLCREATPKVLNASVPKDGIDQLCWFKLLGIILLGNSDPHLHGSSLGLNGQE